MTAESSDPAPDGLDRPQTPEELEEPVATTDHGAPGLLSSEAELRALRELEESNFPPAEGDTQYLITSRCAANIISKSASGAARKR